MQSKSLLCLQMKNKETIVGVIAFLAFLLIIHFALGLDFLIYFTLVFLIAIVAMHLFYKKSLIAKTGAIIIYNDLLFKLLMPKKYKKQIMRRENKKDKMEKETTVLPNNAKSNNEQEAYDAKRIKVLEGLEAVRRRPGAGQGIGDRRSPSGFPSGCGT